MTQVEHLYATWFQPEVADDVLSGGNVNTIEGYAVLHFEAASISSLREKISHLCNAYYYY